MKVVLITGCDTGFGQLLAMKLHELKDFHVVAGCLKDSGRTQYKKLDNITSIQLDVTKHDDICRCTQALSKICDGHGLYGLVNNAGIAHNAPFEWTKDEIFRKVMEVNFFGTVAVTRAVLPYLRKWKGNSRIVNVSSAAGLYSSESIIPYSCSKFAIEAFNDGLRREMLTFTNVSVHCIEPGLFKTNITDVRRQIKQVSEAFKESDNEIKSYYTTSALDMIKKVLEWGASTWLVDKRPEKVVNAICHALTSGFPRRRYTVGTNAILLFKPVSFLHGFVQDILVRAVYREWDNTKRSGNYWRTRDVFLCLGGVLVSAIFMISLNFISGFNVIMSFVAGAILISWNF